MEVKTINGYDIKDEKCRNNKLEHYIIDNTMTQQAIQNIFSIERAKIIEFTTGTYNFSDTFRLNKNTKIILNNSTLNFSVNHAFYNFNDNDEFLLYNGNGNIEIIGGTIDGGSIRFCHANNLNFKNLIFTNSTVGHIIELGACKNVEIKNCKFNGQTTDEINGEVIQLDEMNYVSFPWFSNENNPTYDDTPNTNWIIDNCIFQKAEGYAFHTGIGSHILEVHETHSNIKITNNKFYNFDFSGIRIREIENVVIENNIFEHGTNEDRLVRTIELQQTANNIKIINNIVNGNENGSSKFINCNTDAYDVLIDNNDVFNMKTVEGKTYDDDYVMFIYGKTFTITNNKFHDFEKALLHISAHATRNDTIIMNSNTIYNSTYNDSLIRFYSSGTYTFNYNNISIPTVSSIVRLNSYVTKLICNGNRYANNSSKTFLSINGYTGNYKDISDVILEGFSGNDLTLTSQALSKPYEDFNTLILVCGVASAYLNQYILKPFNSMGNLEASTYYVSSNSDSNSGKIKLKLNDDGTFDFVSDVQEIKCRRIYLLNQ